MLAWNNWKIIFSGDIWWFQGFLTWHKIFKSLDWDSSSPLSSPKNMFSWTMKLILAKWHFSNRRGYTVKIFNQPSLPAHEIESHGKGCMSLGALLIWEFWEVFGNLSNGLCELDISPYDSQPEKSLETIYLLSFYRRNSGDWTNVPEKGICWARTISSPILPPVSRVVSNLHFPQVPENMSFPSTLNKWMGLNGILSHRKKETMRQKLSWFPATNSELTVILCSFPLAKTKRSPSTTLGLYLYLHYITIFSLKLPWITNHLLGPLVNWLSFCSAVSSISLSIGISIPKETLSVMFYAF